MTSSHALWALFAILCVQGITGAAVFLLSRRRMLLARVLPFLISTAAGVLLATACLDLLPEALRTSQGRITPWQILLVSLLVLFGLEATTQSSSRSEAATDIPLVSQSESRENEDERSSHQHDWHGRRSGSAPLLFGSALHSLVDGIAIAAAFAAGARAGWSAAVAVGLHELPHRLSDFSLLLHKGVPKQRAAQLALGAGATALVGGVGVISLGQRAHAAEILLPVSAASFLYIALVDLVPELYAHHRTHRMWAEIACLFGGAAFIAAVIRLPVE